MSSTDRRMLIVDAAIELVAAQGIRALTHRAIDTAMALAPGSTSYYFRTKRALLEAMVTHITEVTRADFATTFTELPPTDRPREVVLNDIAEGVGTWLDRMLAHRRAHLVVRYALTIELSADPELHSRLVGSLFSQPRARELFEHLDAEDPDTTAADFIAVIEGATFDRLAGARAALPAGTPASTAQLTGLLAAYLRGALPGRSP
ncbi:TetR/AcrR family transcriptional regulator [Nocardia cyriacigeorgica]|uniref:TetR family transcriptional regulator n=1 Tax=Nocardia cyriacigeorgica TaxID=135487 RepID=A0A6P1D2R5_9NOCA|nr:TetR family transcriptional regulator [Nocardia cyriacigeorgica]NEW44846.1 TetR family transcriptional regulator [Nocardia cyriacigeorgica]